MKKIYLPIFVTSLLFVLSSCNSTEKVISDIHYKTFTTQAGSITLRDSIIAAVEWGTTSDLAFKNWGRITDIYVLPWEKVKAWQILARLGNNESDIQIRGLSEVVWWLEWIQSDTDSMQQQTELMKESVEQLYNERIGQVDATINQLKNELLKNEKSLTDTTGNIHQKYILELNNFINLANISLYEGDKILGITSAFENTNTTWENYLGMRAWTSRTTSEDSWHKLTESVNTLRKIKDDTKIVITADNATKYIEILEWAYSQLRNYHENMVFMLENSTLWWWLTYELREGWNTLFNKFKSDTAGIEWAFNGWKTSVTPLLVNSSGSKSTQEIGIESIKIQIQNAEKNKDILLAEKSSKLRELNVNIIGIRSKKWELWTKITETRMNEYLAQEANESDIIRAPYDGIILEKYMNIWNIIAPWTPIFRITSEDKSILKIYIDNTLYEYKIWDILDIENPVKDTVMTGTISLLQKERDPIHNKNYTEITLVNSQSVIWERVIVKLSRKKSPHSNGSIVPTNSIITRYGPPWVYILDKDIIRFKLINILASDLYFAEVIGLQDGTTIITDGKESMYDGQILTQKPTLSWE